MLGINCSIQTKVSYKLVLLIKKCLVKLINGGVIRKIFKLTNCSTVLKACRFMFGNRKWADVVYVRTEEEANESVVCVHSEWEEAIFALDLPEHHPREKSRARSPVHTNSWRATSSTETAKSVPQVTSPVYVGMTRPSPLPIQSQLVLYWQVTTYQCSLIRLNVGILFGDECGILRQRLFSAHEYSSTLSLLTHLA